MKKPLFLKLFVARRSFTGSKIASRASILKKIVFFHGQLSKGRRKGVSVERAGGLVEKFKEGIFQQASEKMIFKGLGLG